MKKLTAILGASIIAISGSTFANKIINEGLLVENGKFPKIVFKNTKDQADFNLSYSIRNANWVFDANGNIVSGYENSQDSYAKGLPVSVIGMMFDALNLENATTSYLLTELIFNDCDMKLVDKEKKVATEKLLLNQDGKTILVIDGAACTISVL